MKRLVTDHHRLGIPLMYNVAQPQPPYLELALYTEWKRHTKQNRHIRSHNVYSVGRSNILGGPAETSFPRFRSRIRFLLWQRIGTWDSSGIDYRRKENSGREAIYLQRQPSRDPFVRAARNNNQANMCFMW